MIDLHLLTKIAENDAEFRKSIIRRIGLKSKDFVTDFSKAFRKKNYNSCYYKALSFYQAVMPYCKVSFLNDIQKSLNILSHTADPELKKAICRSILKEVASALVQNQMITKEELTSSTAA